MSELSFVPALPEDASSAPAAPSMTSRLARRLKPRPLTSRQIIVGFKFALAVTLGTLLQTRSQFVALYPPGHALATMDMVPYFTLGCAGNTVGMFVQQFFYRYIFSMAVSSVFYLILAQMGFHMAAQGVVFVVFVYVLNRARIHKSSCDIGFSFAILACVYAIDDNVRNRGAFEIESYLDLLRSWTFGIAVCFGVNLFVLPQFAHKYHEQELVKCFGNMRIMCETIFAASTTTKNHSSSRGQTRKTLAVLREGMMRDWDTAKKWLGFAQYEVAYCRSTLDQRRAVAASATAFQKLLCVESRDGQYTADLPPALTRILEAPSNAFLSYLSVVFDDLEQAVKTDRLPDIEEFEKESRSATQVLSLVETGRKEALQIATRQEESVDTAYLRKLDQVCHALSSTAYCVEALRDLQRTVEEAVSQPRRVHFYLGQHLVEKAQALVGQTRALASSEAPYKGDRAVPRPRWTQRVARFMTSPANVWAMKTTAGLIAFMSILWAPHSRQFFLTYGLRYATVPLLLSLQFTVGLSQILWIGQMVGSVIGIVWGYMSLKAFHRVGGVPFNVPGIIVLELVFALAVSWRLEFDDIFASMALLALGLILNFEYQGRYIEGFPPPEVRMYRQITQICVATAIAIPIQLFIFPTPARAMLRGKLSVAMRKISALATQQIDLSAKALTCVDEEEADRVVHEDAQGLLDRLEGIRDGMYGLGGLVFSATGEWSLYDSFDAGRATSFIESLHACLDAMKAHVAIAREGPFDVRLKEMFSPEMVHWARSFSQTAEVVLWIMSASLHLEEAPPAAMPSLESSSESMILQLKESILNARLVPIVDDKTTDKAILKTWALTFTLLSQQEQLDDLFALVKNKSE